MNKEFIAVCDMVGKLTQIRMSPAQAQLKLKRLGVKKTTAIASRIREIAEQINPKEYDFNQRMIVLATFSAAVADDFGTESNIALLSMLTIQNE